MVLRSPGPSVDREKKLVSDRRPVSRVMDAYLPAAATGSSSILLTAGCATISPRNVLPQASASQIEVEGFHNIRFWGDASAKEIQAVMVADAPQTDSRSQCEAATSMLRWRVRTSGRSSQPLSSRPS
jgi:hypothetical protein